MKYTGIDKPKDVDDELSCPVCNYTEWDARIHMDHHLCEGDIPKE